MKALLTCVCDVSSLNAISESNHTVGISIFCSQSTYYRGNCSIRRCMNETILVGRIEKLFIALHDKKAILKYLADVPVELIPEVLGFLQMYEGLDRIYATMRWWNMPALFSYHCRAKSDTKRKRDECT